MPHGLAFDVWLQIPAPKHHQTSPYPLTTWHRMQREEEVTLDPITPQFRIQEVIRTEAKVLISLGPWFSLTPVPSSGFFLCKQKTVGWSQMPLLWKDLPHLSATSLPLQVQETGSPLIWEYILLQVKPYNKISFVTHTPKPSLSSLWCLHYAFSNPRHFHLIVRPRP